MVEQRGGGRIVHKHAGVFFVCVYVVLAKNKVACSTETLKGSGIYQSRFLYIEGHLWSKTENRRIDSDFT